MCLAPILEPGVGPWERENPRWDTEMWEWWRAFGQPEGPGSRRGEGENLFIPVSQPPASDPRV